MPSPPDSVTVQDADPLEAPEYEVLARRFRPIFEEIGEHALEREGGRILVHDAIESLRQAGFGKLRLPREHGGLGATIPHFFRLLTELATADSNVSHALRGHFAFLEECASRGDQAAIDFWFPKASDGEIIGYAMAERTDETGTSTLLTRTDDGWRLDGVKYYSTGTIYADWIVVTAKEGEDLVSVAVPGRADGVERINDWDGFGQRLTGSGTTKFDRVPVGPDQIIRRFGPDGEGRRDDSYALSFLQMILLATIAGAGRAALRDIVAFVRPRTRAFGVLGQSLPREDPLVQRVVGRMASLTFAAESLVENNARHLEELAQAKLAGRSKPEHFVQANIRTFQAQQMVIDLVLQATNLLFEVGGASATSEGRRLDRHWRNARTAASHNPAIFRERAIGDYLLNGTAPPTLWGADKSKKAAETVGPDRRADPDEDDEAPAPS